MSQLPTGPFRSAVTLLSLFASLLAFVDACAWGALETTPDLQVNRVEVGIEGYSKVGRPTPIAVHVTAARPMQVRLSVKAPDPDGCLVTYPSQPVEFSVGGEYVLRSVFQTGRLDATLRVEIHEDETLLAQWQTQAATEDRPTDHVVLRQSAYLIAASGGPAGFAQLATGSGAEQKSEPARRVRVVEWNDLKALPLGPYALDALDALVVAGNYEIDDAQFDTLQQWVQLGGHLVVSVGRNSEQFQQSKLSRLVARGPQGDSQPLLSPARLRDVSGLETYVAQRARLVFRGQLDAAIINAGREGTVLARSFTDALLVQFPLAFGRVTVLGLDVDRPPFDTWEALPVFWRKLLGMDDRSKESESRAVGGQLSHSGVTDLTTQLQSAGEEFAQIRRSPAWLVMLCILCYVAVIGPTDYLLVHRWLKRPHLTWFTFPVTVLAATAVTVWAAQASNGTDMRVTRVELVDVDARTQVVRTRSWITLYSPQARRYQVHPLPLDGPWDLGNESVQVGWTGVPEESFRGMYRPGGIEIRRPAYAIMPGGAGIEDLPIDRWCTKALGTAAWADNDGAAVVEGDNLSSSGIGDLSDDSWLSHRLPGPIVDWILAYGDRVYRARSGTREGNPLEVLEPGEAHRFTRGLVTRRRLRGLLTGAQQRVVEQNRSGMQENRLVTEQARYDTLSRDFGYILQMLTFHESAGGKSYTNLENNALRELDLTDLLPLNRAVLFGRLVVPSAPVELNEQAVVPDRHEVFVRLVLPVERREGENRGLMDFREIED